MGHNGANTLSTPIVKLQIKDVITDEFLEGKRAKLFKVVVARANYIALDRPDIQYTVKELCRAMTRPTRRDWATLKRFGYDPAPSRF